MVGSFIKGGNGATDTVTGTTLSVGGSATIATQTGDISLTGANVASEGQLAINAARNLTIISAQDTVRNANQSDNKAIGKVVISDTERFAGYHNEKHLDNGNEVKQVASNVGSLKGDVVLSAGEKYTQTSSNVTTGNDVSITAKTIDINTLDNTGSNQTANSDLKIGAFARISSPLIDLASEGQLAINAARNLTITSAQDTVPNANQSDNNAIGKVVISDTERFAGHHNEKHLDNGNEVKQVASRLEQARYHWEL